LLLVLAVADRGRVPAPWIDVVKSVSHADVGAFAARWLLSTTRGLQRSAKLLIGVGLIADGAVRAGLCAGTLRGTRWATFVAAPVFTVLAVGGVIAAGPNPAPLELGTAMANAAVAFVVVVDAYRLRPRVRIGS
jgi:hypothetical protein